MKTPGYIATMLLAAAGLALVSACGSPEESPQATSPETPGAVAMVDPPVTQTNSDVYQFPPPAQSRLVEAEEAIRVTKTHGSDLLVVNYWATWCGPCVEELPYFVRLSKEYNEENVRFVGYSLDFPEEIEGNVDPFLKERGIPYANLVLEVDPNTYVQQILDEWRGNVPATFFYDREGNLVGHVIDSVKYDELSEMVAEILEELGVDAEKTELTDSAVEALSETET
ncbi:MAG: TlpA family protein disulfide reductase [Candidatus Sumerlaeia bacterium]|nr:TlpA family protein disulfide reductase [Candidatus Sumerlaeia bacterium]